MSDKSTLQQFGKTFQCKIISSLLGDKKFLQTISDILEPSYFDSDANRFLSRTIRDYFFEYKTAPTLEVLKVKIDDLDNDILQVAVVENLKESWRYIESTDLPFIQEQTLEFCKNQVIKAAIMDSVDLLEVGKYDEIKNLIDEAMKAGGDRELGHEYIDGIEERLANSARDTIKTGWDSIDEIMDGGLGAGELGVVVAPAGIGKCVGASTEVEIQYEKIGFKVNDDLTMWYNPWDKIEVNDELMLMAYEVEVLLSLGVIEVVKKEVTAKVKLGELFSTIGVPEKENTEYSLKYGIKVKTPYGFKDIRTLQRTEKQQSIRVYFKNHKTLECSYRHQLKANGEWVQIKDLVGDELIETEDGFTTINRIHYGKEKILYDLAVDKVHCFYGNNILSHNSWTLQAIGASAVRNGLNVVYYTLELNQNYVGLRFDTVFSGVTTANIKYYKDEVKKKIAELKGTLLIKYFPTKGATVQTLSSHLKQIELQGTNIDLVLVDYADILRGVGSEKRHILESIYEDLRGLAGEYDLPIWTACFHGDTVISSPNGKFKIKDKVGKSGFPVFSYDKSIGKIVCKTVKSVYKSGENRELWKVVLDNDKEVIVTPNHKFMLRSGEYKELRDLEVGESLMPFNRKMKDNRKQIYLNNGSWQPQYRVVGEWKFGEIPKYYQIHHKDMNKFNDHSDNLELLTISEHYKIHGRKSWDKTNPCGISHLREVYSERMKLNNPMHNKETRIKVGKSRTGKCTGDDNPMRTPEMKEWFANNNPQFKPEVRQKTSNTMVDVWVNRSIEEKNKIFNKATTSRKLTYNNKKKNATELYTDNMGWFDFKKLILREMRYNEDNLYGLYKKLSGIKVSRKEYEKLYNHKIKSIEFYGYDDVYNMEVEDLHNYALDAGVVVKNSQSNRSSLEEDIIDASKVAEAYAKVMIADFVISMSRKVEDKIANTGRFHVIKNRFGVDGITFPASINTNNGSIQIYEANTQDGQVTQKKMDNSEEYLRKQLANKYNSDKDMGGFE